jgi:hypothetical protein
MKAQQSWYKEGTISRLLQARSLPKRLSEIKQHMFIDEGSCLAQLTHM